MRICDCKIEFQILNTLCKLSKHLTKLTLSGLRFLKTPISRVKTELVTTLISALKLNFDAAIRENCEKMRFLQLLFVDYTEYWSYMDNLIVLLEIHYWLKLSWNNWLLYIEDARNLIIAFKVNPSAMTWAVHDTLSMILKTILSSFGIDY